MNKKDFESSLHTLFECVKQHKFENSSLFDGLAGRLLFYHEYFKLNPKKLQSKLIEDDLIELNTLFKSETNLAFANGLTGSMISLIYLSNEERITIGKTYFKDVDAILEKVLGRVIENKKFDFFYGGIGLGFYFIERNLTKSIEFILDDLEKKAVKCIKGYRWQSEVYLPDGAIENVYEISLSHGSAAILTFLTRCLTFKGRIQLKANKLIEEITKHILSCRYSVEGSIYPSFAKIDDPNGYDPWTSRLAWCNGDLGVIYSLYCTSRITNNRVLNKIALDDLLETSKRLSYDETFSEDSSFCHGHSGIALIYHRMYQYTNLQQFRYSRDYWLTKIVKEIQTSPDKKKPLNIYTDDTISMEYGLLKGAVGVGLVLIDYLQPTKSNWSKLLLV